ncbi:MAG: ROK family protein [Synechococcus sp. SB0668_bin_13]|nr:ROK family protein [Cyanobacteria bacterium MAG IRC3_bin_20]MDE0646718.1 ROK family protein [Cyanobacteria bacterium MAG IRC4_bin_6]MXW12752.1 ROK family protein [Synechococcus sp. SB0668_bin_13]MYK07563.1 ROK family protein [Synechococcus sp. SB0670_bin_20]
MPLPAPQVTQVIGVDIGGTALKLGRFGTTGYCHAHLELPTPQPATPGAVTTALLAGLERLDPQHQASGIGIGVPGPANQAGRVARLAINLPGWRDVPLADWLEAQQDRPVTIANDADCAALGELWLGAGRGVQDLLLLSLGTGVGGAVIMGGRLLTGRLGIATEPGLILLDPSGPLCNSGNHGSLQQHCSISALKRLSGLEPVALAARAARQDSTALAHWRTYGRRLGMGIASLAYLFTPERVLLGGGVAGALPYFRTALEQELQQRLLPMFRQDMVILPCALGNGAGRAGAARLALDRC